MIYTDTIYIPVRRRPKNAGKNLSRKKSAGNLGRNHGSSSRQPILRGYKIQTHLALAKRTLYLEINFRKKKENIEGQTRCRPRMTIPSDTRNALRQVQFQQPLLQCRRNILFPANSYRESNARNSILRRPPLYPTPRPPSFPTHHSIQDKVCQRFYGP